MKDGAERPIPLPKPLKEVEAVEINEDVEALKITLSILKGNYEELIGKHYEYQDFEYDDWVSDEVEIFKLLKEDYFRLLHNYITSVYTLINHSQRIVNKYGDEGFAEQYSEEIQEREIDTKGAFLQQLRHYTQKRKVPPIQATFEFHQEEPDFSLRLRKDMIESWDGWNNDAQQYLSSLDDQIPLKELIENYQNEIESFYGWFFKYVKLYFKKEYDEAKKIIQEIEEEKPDTMMYSTDYFVPFDVEDFE